MTTWVWFKKEHTALAQFINEEAAWGAAALDLGINRLDEEVKEGGRGRIAKVIYDKLRRRRPRIAYDREPFLRHGDYRQKIRTPRMTLETDHRGTCLDLALLFCALCLKNDLLPFLLIVEGHALAAVHLTQGRKSQGNDAWDAFNRPGFDVVQAGMGEIASRDVILGWIARGILLPVECTGFAHSNALPDTCPEGCGRKRGFLNFVQAVAAGRAQIEKGARSFQYAIDIQFLLDEVGLEPFAPPDWSPAVPTVAARRSHIPAEYLSWLTSRMFAYGDFHAKTVRDRLANEVCHNWQIEIPCRPEDPLVDLHLILTKVCQQVDGQSFFETVLPAFVAGATPLGHLIDYARDLAALAHLRPLLAQVNFGPRELHRCYSASLPDPQRARDVATVEEALHDLLDMAPLLDMPPSRRTPWRPICEFVERISRLCQSEDLHAWVEQRETDPARRAALRETLDREEAEAVDYIVVDVPSPKPDAIEIWRRFDRNNRPQVHDVWPCPAAAAPLTDAVSLLADRAADWSVNARLELFLPVTMLASDPDQWPCETFEGTCPLGERYGIAVRWRERGREGVRRAPWERFAAELENRGQQPPVLGWLDAGRPAEPDLPEKVSRGDLGHCLAFLFSPFAAGSRAPHALLKTALGGGMTYGVWLRSDPADWQAFREDLATVFSAGDLEAMPERIKEARRKAGGAQDPANPFRNLTLFWDDPRRDPWRDKFTQPGQRR